jgi:hypothetical protein
MNIPDDQSACSIINATVDDRNADLREINNKASSSLTIAMKVRCPDLHLAL